MEYAVDELHFYAQVWLTLAELRVTIISHHQDDYCQQPEEPYRRSWLMPLPWHLVYLWSYTQWWPLSSSKLLLWFSLWIDFFGVGFSFSWNSLFYGLIFLSTKAHAAFYLELDQFHRYLHRSSQVNYLYIFFPIFDWLSVIFWCFILAWPLFIRYLVLPVRSWQHFIISKHRYLLCVEYLQKRPLRFAQEAQYYHLLSQLQAQAKKYFFY